MLLSWCGWHMQVLSNFMKTLTWACYEAFVAMAEGKRCHGGGTKMVPRQHSGPDNSSRCRCERKCGCAEHAKMVGVIPVTGGPTWRWLGKRGASQATTQSRCKHMVHLIHARASHRGRLGLYLQSVHFWSGVEEVDVLTTVVEVDGHGSSGEVVVHVRFRRGTWRIQHLRGDGSGSRTSWKYSFSFRSRTCRR